MTEPAQKKQKTKGQQEGVGHVAVKSPHQASVTTSEVSPDSHEGNTPRHGDHKDLLDSKEKQPRRPIQKGERITVFVLKLY